MKLINSTKLCALLLIMCVLFTACSNNSDPSHSDESNFNVIFFRKVAREVYDNGWVFTFVNEGYKDTSRDSTNLAQYSFYGINIRYKHDDAYIHTYLRERPNGTRYYEYVAPPCLIFGEGSEAEKRDVQKVQQILDHTKTPEEILATNPDDYDFEVLDKDMFFSLIRKAITGQPQKEGTEVSYWEKPIYAFFTEPEYKDGYKFQIAFLHETGCVDELFIDVLYETGEEYDAYIQLSDLVSNGEATNEQKEAFALITSVTSAIKEDESFITECESYMRKSIGNIDFSRLYDFLYNIHINNHTLYYEQPIIISIEEVE